ncbi:MAG: GNAT family N-acetyltransferase [Roseburia sp.]|nr:GNAT family N-acetyltransferase [Roseburia sp.]MCM1242909.1 GNAT family N-acetyltransferase [Roseburia sp.]
MEIHKLSTAYKVSVLSESDIPTILSLCQKNPQYYRYCPPAVSDESIRNDMQALPEGKPAADKYYLGFWNDTRLIAVMDLIMAYPDKETAFIGFFMMNMDMQGKGIGSKIIEEACDYLKEQFSFIRLGVVEGNKQAEHFWRKNGFVPTGQITQTKEYRIVGMKKALSCSLLCGKTRT